MGYAGYWLVRRNFSLAMPHHIEEGYSKTQLGLCALSMGRNSGNDGLWNPVRQVVPWASCSGGDHLHAVDDDLRCRVLAELSRKRSTGHCHADRLWVSHLRSRHADWRFCAGFGPQKSSRNCDRFHRPVWLRGWVSVSECPHWLGGRSRRRGCRISDHCRLKSHRDYPDCADREGRGRESGVVQELAAFADRPPDSLEERTLDILQSH